jgi:hypothetical protein
MERIVVLLLLLVSFVAWGSGHASCHQAVLEAQRKDVATVQRLELAWTQAFLSGDVDFERCLLTEDFTEILRDGTVTRLEHELALAAQHRGRAAQPPAVAPGEVYIHGDVAVAYGASRAQAADGAVRATRYADYYLWEHGRWRAFFAQQTPIVNP